MAQQFKAAAADNYTLSRKMHFYKRLIISVSFAILLLLVSLGVGMWGYHYFEGMSAVDAFVNAAMILSGMGPVDPLHTEGGKIFAGCYAIYSGVAFLVSIAVVLAPILHHGLHLFHLELSENKDK